MKKIVVFGVLVVAGLSLFAGIVNAAVTEYKSSLSLDTAHLQGAWRYYGAGTQKFKITPDKLTPQEAGEYVQLRLRLDAEYSDVCGIDGVRYLDMYKQQVKTEFTADFGRQAAANRSYYMQTDHDGRDWGYVYAKYGHVIMGSY